MYSTHFEQDGAWSPQEIGSVEEEGTTMVPLDAWLHGNGPEDRQDIHDYHSEQAYRTFHTVSRVPLYELHSETQWDEHRLDDGPTKVNVEFLDRPEECDDLDFQEKDALFVPPVIALDKIRSILDKHVGVEGSYYNSMYFPCFGCLRPLSIH
jgi:hypothetical protein